MAATLPRTFHRDTPRYDQPVSIPGRIGASLMRALDRAGRTYLNANNLAAGVVFPNTAAVMSLVASMENVIPLPP
jgi:hypothetical protein